MPILAPDTQGIVGVVSQATGRPFKIAGFLPEDAAFSGAAGYADWRFVFSPPATPAQQAQSSP